MANDNEIKVRITAENVEFLNAIRDVVKTLKGVKDQSTQIKPPADFLQTLSQITVVGYGVVEMFSKLQSIAKAVVMTGIEYNKQMETGRLGIAGILMSMTSLHGKQLKLNQAMQVSDQLLKQIQVSATQIGLPAQEMMEAFQSVTGPGLAAKMTLEEIAQLVPTATKAVKTLLGSMGDSRQVAQELRAMVSGDITMDAQVSKALGITKKEVDEAKKNAGGLFAYLMDKMSGFKEIAIEWPKTMTGALEKFKASYSQASGNAFEKVFDKAKEKLNAITDALFVVNKETKLIEFKPELLKALQSMVDYAILFAEKIISAANTAIPLLGTPLQVIGNTLKFVIDNVYGVTTALGTWMIIQKAIILIETFRTKMAAAMATAAAGAGGATKAIGKMETALIAVKTAIRGLASATLWGAVAVAAGYAVEKIVEHFDKLDRKKKKMSGEEDKDFGWLSKGHEGDYDTVSTGENDPYGGVSYGSWQFASLQGTPKRFVEWLVENGWDAGRDLKYGGNAAAGIPEYEVNPGTPEFSDRWRRAAEKYGRSFENAQRGYAKEAYYDPANEHLKTFGFDADTRSKAMREVVLSTAIQHGQGGFENIMRIVAQTAGVANASYLTDEQLIPYIYQARTQVFPQDRERYIAEQREAMDFLATNPQSTNLGKVNADDLKLKNEQEDADAKAIAAAKVKLAKAIADGELSKYLADIQQQEQALENRYKNTQSGTLQSGEVSISEADYNTEKKRLEIEKAMAEIENLKKELTEKTAMLSDVKQLKETDKLSLQADIEKIQSDIEVKKKNLETALQALDNTSYQAQKALEDQAGDVNATNLENDNKFVEAVKKRLEKQNRALREIFKTNGMTDALKALEQTEQHEINNARFEQAQKDIDTANSELGFYEAKLLEEIAGGATQAQDVIRGYIDKFHALTDDKLTDLKKQLEDAISRGSKTDITKIRTAIKDLSDNLKDGLENLIKAYDSDLQMKIAEINANRSLTNGQKQDAIDEAQRGQYAIEAAKKRQEIEDLRADNNDGKNNASIQAAERVTALKEQLSELPTLLDKVRESSKQAFEDGLFDFLSRGINECKSLGDAFRDMANSILQSIQRVYAEALTKNIMGALFPVAGANIPGSGNSRPNGTLGPLRPDGSFAEGGAVRGPGTGTSDSILAALSNGEFVINAAAVKRVGADFLQRLNSGDIYNLRIPMPRFARGGLVGGVGARAAAKGRENLLQDLGLSVSPNINVNNYVDGQRIFDAYGRPMIRSEMKKEFMENAKLYSMINKRCR